MMTTSYLATVAVTVALATPALAQMTTVEADHNGSLMRIEAFQGGHTVIRYVRPREGLSKADVVPGMIVFTGQLAKDGKLTGKAYAFKAGCGPAQYDVTGTAEDATTLVLRGPGPQRKGCAVVGYREDSPHSVLKFTFGAGTLAHLWDDPARPRTGAEMREILTQPPPPSPVTAHPVPSAETVPLRPSQVPPAQPETPAAAQGTQAATVAPVVTPAPAPLPPVPPAIEAQAKKEPAQPAPVPAPTPAAVAPEPPRIVAPGPTPLPAKPAEAEPVKPKKPKLDADL